MLREDQKEFIKSLNRLAHRHSVWDVWSDWLIMASSSVYNSIHQDPKVENEYLSVAKRYTSDELVTMGHMLGAFVQGMETDPDRDFLGEVMGELSLHNTARGQFFTPMSVAHLCADLNLPESVEPGRVIKVNEPACGSGNMVIAFWTAIRTRGLPQAQFHFVCQDIDDRAFRMCYLQLGVLGLSAEVCLGDTLKGTTDRVWRTPGWYLHQMQDRLLLDAGMRLVAPIPANDYFPEPEPEQAPQATAEAGMGIPEPEQLSLF